MSVNKINSDGILQSMVANSRSLELHNDAVIRELRLKVHELKEEIETLKVENRSLTKQIMFSDAYDDEPL